VTIVWGDLTSTGPLQKPKLNLTAVSYPHGESQAEAGRGAVGMTKRPASALEDIMTTEQKIIRAKVGLLELAKQLGNVSQACKMMGYSRDDSPGPPWKTRLHRASLPIIGLLTG
jgi:hypothetical protein